MKSILAIGLPPGILPAKFVLRHGEEVAVLPLSDSVLNSISADIQGIFIFCEHHTALREMAGDGQTLPGLTTARHLRKSGLTLPIFFVSFLSRAQILALQPSASILTALGSHFLRLPATPAQIAAALETARPLTPLELQDVQLFSTDNAGALNELLHTLSGGALASLLQTGDEQGAIARLIAVLRQAYALYNADPTEAEKTLRDELAALMATQGNLTPSLLPAATEKVRGLCQWLAASYNSDAALATPIRHPEKKPWKVLVLDDEIDESAPLIAELKAHVSGVICCTTAAEAFDALRSEDNWRSDIPVMLCDYRLLAKDEDGVTVQQPVQGYTFINQVSEGFDNRIISAVIYSGLPRRFLLRTARQLKLRCEPISKIEHRLEDRVACRHIIDTLLSLGDDAYDAMLALPLSSSSVWKRTYNALYIEHRSRPGYQSRELHIREYCTRWAALYLRREKPLSPVTFTDPPTALKTLDDPSTARKIDELLKGRRLAIWLYLRQHELVDIGKILRKKGAGLQDKTYTTFLSQALALQLSDYPFGLTIEELNWLQYDMGIMAVDAYRPLRSALLDTEQLIGQFLTTAAALQEKLKALNYEAGGK